MLIEGAGRFARAGREALQRKDFEKVYDNFTATKNILVELMGSLRPEVAPELCASLQGLYTFMFNRLVEGSFEKDISKIDEVIELLDFERETWLKLMAKLAEERGSTPSATVTAPTLAPGAMSTQAGATPTTVGNLPRAPLSLSA